MLSSIQLPQKSVIYLKAESERERDRSSPGSLPKCLQLPGLGHLMLGVVHSIWVSHLDAGAQALG